MNPKRIIKIAQLLAAKLEDYLEEEPMTEEELERLLQEFANYAWDATQKKT